MQQQWEELQREILPCTQCKGKFPAIPVDCPPNNIYPEEITPPDPVRILFIGVAPPEKGRNFFTDDQDNLRRGLFSVLGQLHYPCDNGFDRFLNYGFFLVHTAKCAINCTSKPCIHVSRFCSSQFLHREIRILLPDAVVWLSKTIGHKVCQQLGGKIWSTQDIPFGKATPLMINGKKVLFLPTKWPGRGHERETKEHLKELFALLKLLRGALNN